MKPFIETAQLITAVVSLFVAGLAIWYTIKSREDDLSYRELLIKPTLAIYVDPSAGKIKLKNLGLGPALIKTVRYKIGDDEIVDNLADNELIDTAIPPNIQDMQIKIVRALVNQEYYNRIYNDLPQIDINSFFPYSGHTLPVNSEYSIVEIENIKSIETAFSKKSSKDRFEKWISSIGLSSRGEFQISYCSITGKWCGKTKIR